MNIMLNSILNLSTQEINNSKIELNMTAGSGKESFLDRWLKHSPVEKENGYGKNWDCSFWSMYGNQRNFKKGNLVFSFIRLSTATEWLFISAAEISEVTNEFAKVKILKRFSPFFGKLVISCYKGNAMGRYVFNLSKFLDQVEVKEILPCLYSGEKFPGYKNVFLPYKKLTDIFEGRIMPTYKEALEQISGIYCLTDTKTGKLYIGSAYGEGGVWKRWGDYFHSKDGNNKKLIELRKQKSEEYFKENFTFSLLETFDKQYDKDKIIEREQHWKKCFSTIQNGYNAN
mgnify:CR=1 FL=1